MSHLDLYFKKTFARFAATRAAGGVAEDTDTQLCGGCGAQRPSPESIGLVKFCFECGCKYGSENSDVGKGKKYV